MMKIVACIACAVAFIVLSTRVSAQLPTSRLLTVEVSEVIARAAMAKCRMDGLKATVVVVDALNSPKVILRDDGASAATAEVARMKASYAMLYNRPSGPTRPLPEGVPIAPAVVPGTYNSPGGVPIKIGDVTIGAVAVGATHGPTGLSSAQYQEMHAACAKAGIAAAADRLK